MSLPTVCRRETEGNSVRDCPGTRKHVCCGYKTIDLIEGCPLSCSYCILRGYLNKAGIFVQTNVGAVIGEIDRAIAREGTHVPRFGTGELSDSLALDRRLDANRRIVEFFGERKKALLELKSKWASIDHLRSCLNPYVIVSFSVAPQRFIGMEEKGTSPLSKRLKALKLAQDWGCFVGLHLDPVVMYEGFERDYKELIDEIADMVDLTRVIWISMGLLRFTPRLMKIFLEERRANLLHGEFIMGEDGKFRYIKAERIRIYRMLYGLLKEKEAALFIYLCMERPEVWRQVTGGEVGESEDLIRLFDGRIREFYGGAL
ncbi:MAG: spore photoproduct lyase family protein [Syntrophorhabdales bacterium]